METILLIKIILAYLLLAALWWWLFLGGASRLIWDKIPHRYPHLGEKKKKILRITLEWVEFTVRKIPHYPYKQYIEKKGNTSKEEYAAFVQRFMKNRKITDRACVYISREFHRRMAAYLEVIAPDVSITSYLNNIVMDHFERTIDKMLEIYANEKQNNG